jgi:hypothetical protein
MANELQFYDAAKAALEKAVRIDEVQKIHNAAAATKAAARVAGDRTLEANAHEIRLRAERRLGQLMDRQRQSVGFNKGGRGKKRVSEKPSIGKPTLAEVGIDKNLAHRSRTAAGLSDHEFERMVAAENRQIESPDRFEKFGAAERYATIKDAQAAAKRLRLPDATERISAQCVTKIRESIEITIVQMRRRGAGAQQISFLFQRLFDELQALENKHCVGERSS